MLSQTAPPRYPPAPRADIDDLYGDVAVADPFRPLEDLDAPATVAWIEAENAVTQALLATVGEREAIRSRLSVLWDYERRSLPSREGSVYAYFKNDGLQNQAVLYVADTARGDGARVLLDPNTLSTDGTVALNSTSFSKDGFLVAYALSNVRIRLADLARSRCRHRQGSAGPDSLEQVLGRELAARRQRLLLRAIRRARGGREIQGSELLP